MRLPAQLSGGDIYVEGGGRIVDFVRVLIARAHGWWRDVSRRHVFGRDGVGPLIHEPLDLGFCAINEPAARSGGIVHEWVVPGCGQLMDEEILDP